MKEYLDDYWFMKFQFSKTEHDVLQTLHKGAKKLDTLKHDFLQKGVSRSNFYQVLKNLREEEVVVLQKKVVSLNKLWLKRASIFFQSASADNVVRNYFAKQLQQLDESDGLVYKIGNLAQADIFILNVLLDVVEITKAKKIFIIQDHEFFVLVNNERTDILLHQIEDAGGSIFLICTQETNIDKQVCRTILKDPVQSYVGDFQRKISNKIIHVVDDIIISLRMPKKLGMAIDKLYAKENISITQARKHLHAITNERQRLSLTIRRDVKQAQRVQKQFRKYF